jgi:hypothetical protein
MNYTKLKDLTNLTDKDIIEAVAGTICFVADPETAPSKSTGKPVTKQCICLESSDGAKVYADIYAENNFMDRSRKGQKVIIASTVKDGKMQGINLNLWNEKARLMLFGGTNITFVDSPAMTIPQQPAPQQQATQQQSAPAQQYKQQPKQPVNGFGAIAALWSECYNYVLPICGEASAVQAAATLFIEANKKGITATVTAPAEALKQLLPDARKLAETIVAKGGYDYDKLPTGDDLDAVVDILIDKAAETKSREAIGVAFDKFIAGCNRSRGDAVRLLVSDWRMFLDTVA